MKSRAEAGRPPRPAAARLRGTELPGLRNRAARTCPAGGLPPAELLARAPATRPQELRDPGRAAGPRQGGQAAGPGHSPKVSHVKNSRRLRGNANARTEPGGMQPSPERGKSRPLRAVPEPRVRGPGPRQVQELGCATRTRGAGGGGAFLGHPCPSGRYWPTRPGASRGGRASFPGNAGRRGRARKGPGLGREPARGRDLPPPRPPALPLPAVRSHGRPPRPARRRSPAKPRHAPRLVPSRPPPPPTSSTCDWLRPPRGRGRAKGGGFKMAAARRRLPAESAGRARLCRRSLPARTRS